MNRNPLVATPIVDSRGRQTTVYKRADAGISKAASSIPKVSVSKPEPDNSTLIVNFSFEAECMSSKMSDNVRDKLMETLNEGTIGGMERLMRDHGVSVITFRMATSWCVANRNFAVLNGFVKLLDEQEDKGRDNQLHVLYSLMGVQMALNPREKPIDITNPNDPRAEGGRALAKVLMENIGSGLVVRRNLKKGQAAYTFDVSELEVFIREHPDRADDIVDFYKKRAEFDWGLYEEFVKNDVNSLSDGIL